MEEKIKEWFDFNLKDSGPFGFRYIGEGSPCVVSDRLLYFENHQYLTLDQWAELFLPKEEFSNGQIVHEHGSIYDNATWVSGAKFALHLIEDVVNKRKNHDV